jgi:hypothetical protein
MVACEVSKVGCLMNPTFSFLIFLRRHLELGHSPQVILSNYLKSSKSDEFSDVLRKWYLRKTQQLPISTQLFANLKSPYRRQILILLEAGFRGESIYRQIVLLEQELLLALDFEIQKRAATLPLKMLFPLLLMQFPAVAGVILVPFLENLFHSFN